MVRLTKVEMAANKLRYTDVLDMAELLISRMSPAIPCKGLTCEANCCVADLTITWIEYYYLSKHPDFDPQDNGSMCPCLKDGLCTVYSNRPLECRLYNRIDEIIGMGCGYPHKMDKEYIVIRELLYRAVWSVNGDADERTIAEWHKEGTVW